MRDYKRIFPMDLPTSADLEEAAQKLEKSALCALGESDGIPGDIDPDRAGLFFLAAAAYRQVYEERQTREALRAILQKFTSKSVFEHVFGRERRWPVGAR